jgi:hypothetical protein
MSLQKTVYGFIPTSITGCALWLDGADPAGNGVVPANNTAVTTWVDKSGNANNGTSGSAYFLIDSAGGYINFTGSQTYTITNPNIVVNQYFTIFVIEQLQNYTGGEAAFMGGSGSTNANLHMRYYNGNAIKFGFFSNDLDASVTAFFTNATQPIRIWSFSFTASSRVIYLNGTSIGSDTNNTQLSGWAGATIGAMVPYGGQYYNGKMREVMIYSGTMATTQRQQVEGYLAQKWGLTSSLPVGHPGLGTTLYRSDYTKQNIMRAIPYYTAFSPRSIAGCALWLDGADSSSISFSSGSNVSTWNDKSGNAANATASGSGLIYTQSAINSKPAILLPGNSTYTFFTGTSISGTLNQAIFIVTTTISGITQYARLFSFGGGSDYNSLGNMAVNWNSPGGVLIERNQIILPSTNGLVYSTPFITSSVISGTSVLGYINGTNALTGTTTSTNFTHSQYELGSYTGYSGYTWYGYVGEVIVYNSAISDAQRQQVESYLAQKWGLTASLPGGHLNATQPAGAVTTTALANSKTLLLPRIVFSSTGLVITHQDGRTWKTTANATGYANYSIGLNSGTPMSLNIYAGSDVFNSAGGRVALFNNGDSNNAVRHAGYVMWTYIFGANNFDYGWKFVSSGSGYLIYNDYPSIGSAWQASYDPSADRVLIVSPSDSKYGMVWNVTPKVTLAYVYSSYT